MSDEARREADRCWFCGELAEGLAYVKLGDLEIRPCLEHDGLLIPLARGVEAHVRDRLARQQEALAVLCDEIGDGLRGVSMAPEGGPRDCATMIRAYDARGEPSARSAVLAALSTLLRYPDASRGEEWQRLLEQVRGGMENERERAQRLRG